MFSQYQDIYTKSKGKEMLVVRVELWSSRTRQKTEIARMHICNTGEGNDDVADYYGETFKGRSTEALDKKTVVRTGEISNWPKQRNHVWKLVAKMLATMGYL